MLEIKRITVEPTDVYDLTVPKTQCFFANDVLVHNCMEINLPTKPFQRLDDEGDFELELDDGTSVNLAGEHKVMLVDGSRKKVRELTESDDIKDLML